MNIVRYRAYIRGKLIAQSPFLIGSYDDDHTDIVVLKDDDLPFLPGSSLAGVLRGLFERNEHTNRFFGYSIKLGSKQDSRQSMLITYDCFPDPTCIPTFAMRDGIRLEFDNKITTAEGKYNYEVVESGAIFDFKMEFILRDGYAKDKNQYFQLLNMLVAEMCNGIYIGSKTNRGLGHFKLDNPQVYEVDVDNRCEDAYDRYIQFCWEKSEFIPFNESCVAKYAEGSRLLAPKLKQLKFGIQFPATILIRDYSSVNEKTHDADCIMIASNEGPIIPGTSWGGLFRHGAKRVLIDLGCADIAEVMIADMFGSENKKCKKKEEEQEDEIVHASRVAFGESVITGSISFIQDHVKIDRFTQGAVDGAKFNAGVIAGGYTTLNIRYCEDWMKDLIMLVMADLNDGFFALGGQTSVGRGFCLVEKGLEECNGEMLLKEIEIRRSQKYEKTVGGAR